MKKTAKHTRPSLDSAKQSERHTPPPGMSLGSCLDQAQFLTGPGKNARVLKRPCPVGPCAHDPIAFASMVLAPFPRSRAKQASKQQVEIQLFGEVRSRDRVPKAEDCEGGVVNAVGLIFHPEE